MIKHELAKDERLRNENWDRFLPDHRPKSVRHKKKPAAAAGAGPTTSNADSALRTQTKPSSASDGPAASRARAQTDGAASSSTAAPPKAAKRRRKEYTPFPPPQPPSRKDIELETGEYFLGEQQRRAKRLALRKVHPLSSFFSTIFFKWLCFSVTFPRDEQQSITIF